MNERFIGKVVSVDDPEQAGRVKVRIFGKYDDEINVPDDMLPWARCVYPVTNAVHKGVSGPTTGLVVGSTVVGHFVDKDCQIPIVEGVLGAVTEEFSDFPKSNRGEDVNEVIGDNLFNVATTELKFLSSKTIGNIEYVGQDIKNVLQSIQEDNLVNGLRKAKSAMSSIRQLKEVMTSSPFSQLQSLIDGAKSDLLQLGKDELGGVIESTGVGNVINMGGTDIIDKVTGGNILNGISGLEPIGRSLLGNKIGSATDALNKIGGNRFIMNGPMKGINSSLNDLKSKAKKKKLVSQFADLKKTFKEAKSVADEVKDII